MTTRTLADAPPTIATKTSLRADLSVLLKPRITLMVVLTTAVGYAVATPQADWGVLIAALAGTALLASGSSVFNQMVEHRTDARMPRTADRPLPAGRLSLESAAVIGTLLSLLGTAALVLWVNPLTAVLGVVTLILYIAAYTPLKRRSSLATLVGAVPGAIPPMMGVTAATGSLSSLAWALFGLLFLWQMPHFLAIAWMYRHDYAQGGLPMLTVGEARGAITWRQMIFYSAALVPVSLLPSVTGYTGVVYLIAALGLGAWFLRDALSFGRAQDAAAAKKLLLTSVMYLPAVLALMVVDAAFF
ncbi:MAG: heme o synthase [Acidobacteriota bacterium]